MAMDNYESRESEPEAEFADGGSRAVAGFIDFLFAGVIAILVYLLMGISPLTLDIVGWLIFLLVLGIFHMLLNAAFEASRARSIGKYTMGIEVYSLREDPEVTGGQAFGRNASKIHLILYVMDILAGVGGQPTQKGSDKSVDTVLIKSRPTIVRRPRKRKAPAWTRDVDDSDMGLSEDEETRRRMIDYLRHGKCSRCGSPFRILEKGDTSWTGLWNSRCTWCNKMVFEDDATGNRVEPGFKPEDSFSRFRSRGLRDWERGSYDDWERGGGGGAEPGFRP